MADQGSRSRGSLRTVRGIVICSNAKILYIAPFWDLGSPGQLQKVRQRRPQIVEFLGPAEDEPSCSTEVRMAEDIDPGPDTEIWRLGPPLRLIACAHGARGCNHT
ncbi:hypothetical protein ACFV7R_35060 [Streptomyces sp. NPDC059866]|uniref:hypothetical protein n=1 Tax=Streptomyces sp. NPDC059866 TaxID=3346978 RepID=UPI0036658CD7